MDTLELLTSKIQGDGLLVIGVLLPTNLQKIFDHYNTELGQGPTLLARCVGHYSNLAGEGEEGNEDGNGLDAGLARTSRASLEEVFRSGMAELKEAINDEFTFSGIAEEVACHAVALDQSGRLEFALLKTISVALDQSGRLEFVVLFVLFKTMSNRLLSSINYFVVSIPQSDTECYSKRY
jgi:hypothetical protein